MDEAKEVNKIDSSFVLVGLFCVLVSTGVGCVLFSDNGTMSLDGADGADAAKRSTDLCISGIGAVTQDVSDELTV